MGTGEAYFQEKQAPEDQNEMVNLEVLYIFFDIEYVNVIKKGLSPILTLISLILRQKYLENLGEIGENAAFQAVIFRSSPNYQIQ